MSFIKSHINSFVRYTIYFIEMIVFFMLWQIPSAFPLLFGVKPILLFVFVITLALLENEIITLTFSLISGVLIDYSFGMTVGSITVVLMIVCCVINAIAKRKISITIFSSFAVIIIAVGVLCLYLWYSNFISQGYTYIFEALLSTYIPVWFYTALVSPIVYILNIGILQGLDN